MTTVMIDEGLRAKLKDFDHEVILTDESGQKVGRFLPEAEYMKMLYDRARLMVTDEELERARNEPGGSTLAEIWERLRKKS